MIAAGERRLESPKPGVYAQVIAGPTGAGKSRLLDELADRAEQYGWMVVSTGAERSGAMTALWPIRQAVARLLGVDPQSATPSEIGRAANLVGLSFEALPGLQELFGVGVTSGIGGTTMEHAVRRRECFSSAVQALLEGAAGRPLLLTLDDIDRWDAPSRHILQQLIRAQSEHPVLILIATSEEQREWLSCPIAALPPLRAGEVQSWAASLADGDSSLPKRLASHAPMTPFELELALRSMPAPGQPINFEAAAKTWLATIAAPERQVLELCSVLGERAEYDDLVALRSSDPAGQQGELAEHLRGLTQAGLLREDDGCWAFRSRRIREHVLQTIEPERARHLHREAAMRTEIAQLTPTVRALFLLRAQPAKVRDTTGRLQAIELIEALREAALSAVAAFDDVKAVRLLRTALKACRRLSDQERVQHEADLIAELVDPFCFTDDVDEAISTLRKVLGSGRATDRDSELNRALGRCLARKRDWQGAIDAYQRALGPLIAQGRRETLLELYADLARAWAAAGKQQRALAELNEGLDMVTLGDGPRARVDVSMWRYLLAAAELHERAGDVRMARVWVEHALFQADRRNEELGQMRGHEALGRLLRALGQTMLAEQHIGRGLDLARKLGDRRTSAELLLARAELRRAAGRPDEARRCAQEGLRLAQLLEWERGIQRAQSLLQT